MADEFQEQARLAFVVADLLAVRLTGYEQQLALKTRELARSACIKAPKREMVHLVANVERLRMIAQRLC